MKFAYLVLVLLALLFLGCTEVQQEESMEDIDNNVPLEDKSEVEQDTPDLALNQCPESCEDNNNCTEDSCSSDTNFICVHSTISPCCGDNICEDDEICKIDCKSEISTDDIRVNISHLFGDIDYYDDLYGRFKKIIFEIENKNEVPVSIERINLKVNNVKGDQYDKKQEIYSYVIDNPMDVNSKATIASEHEIEPMFLELKSPKNLVEKFEIIVELEFESGETASSSQTLYLDNFFFYTRLFRGGSVIKYYNDKINFNPESREYRGYLAGTGLAASEVNREKFTTGLDIPVITNGLIFEFNEYWAEEEREVDHRTKEYITSFPLEVRIDDLNNLPNFKDMVIDFFILSYDNRYYYSYPGKILDKLDFEEAGSSWKATLELKTDFKKPSTKSTNRIISYVELREKNNFKKYATAYRDEVVRD